MFHVEHRGGEGRGVPRGTSPAFARAGPRPRGDAPAHSSTSAPDASRGDVSCWIRAPFPSSTRSTCLPSQSPLSRKPPSATGSLAPLLHVPSAAREPGPAGRPAPWPGDHQLLVPDRLVVLDVVALPGDAALHAGRHLWSDSWRLAAYPPARKTATARCAPEAGSANRRSPTSVSPAAAAAPRSASSSTSRPRVASTRPPGAR
jgi:hypothetical protein